MIISPQKVLTKIHGLFPIFTELFSLSSTRLQKYGVVSQSIFHALFCLYNRTKFISKKSINQAEVFLCGFASPSFHRDSHFLYSKKALLRRTVQALALEEQQHKPFKHREYNHLNSWRLKWWNHSGLLWILGLHHLGWKTKKLCKICSKRTHLATATNLHGYFISNCKNGHADLL